MFNPEKKLKLLLNCVIEEMKINQEFATKIDAILMEGVTVTPVKPKKSRNPAIINPLELLEKDESLLLAQLKELTLEQLKDIVAEYGMDNSKLAIKWKSAERLINLIVDTSRRRCTKGDAFRK